MPFFFSRCRRRETRGDTGAVARLKEAATLQVNHLLILDAADDKKAKYESLDQWLVPIFRTPEISLLSAISQIPHSQG